MTSSWKVKGKNVETVKNEIQSSLASMGLPSFANVTWQGDELCVLIDKGGKSEFRLAMKPDGSDVKIVETKRSISFLHKPFTAKVESAVEQLLGGIGAAKA